MAKTKERERITGSATEHLLQMRVPRALKKRLHDEAASEGMTLSAYCRHLLTWVVREAGETGLRKFLTMRGLQP